MAVYVDLELGQLTQDDRTYCVEGSLRLTDHCAWCVHRDGHLCTHPHSPVNRRGPFALGICPVPVKKPKES